MLNTWNITELSKIISIVTISEQYIAEDEVERRSLQINVNTIYYVLKSPDKMKIIINIFINCKLVTNSK